MILTLQEAQQLDSSIAQSTLDAYEAAIRQLTNNNFQLFEVRGTGLTIDGATVTIEDDDLTEAARTGDTIEINGAGVNDGLYTIVTVGTGTITLDREPRVADEFEDAIATLVAYPADVKEGVRKLIAYDKKMASKTGIKSETISRMSVTYYDATANESVGGYPANLMDFVRKYAKMRWGS